MSASSGNFPLIDPADNGTLAGSMRIAFSALMKQTDGMLPAQVVAYDRDTNRVQVQLLMAMVTTDGVRVTSPQIASIPVLVLGGGGFMINFPLAAGNLGWVMASDRDISTFLETYTESTPNTARIKDFSSALFVPDVMTGYTINEEDSGSAVFSNTYGTVRISLSDTCVSINAPCVNVTAETVDVNSASNVVLNTPSVTMTGDLQVDGDLLVLGEIEAQGGMTGPTGTPLEISGDVDMVGELAVDGNITATGTITPEV